MTEALHAFGTLIKRGDGGSGPGAAVSAAVAGNTGNGAMGAVTVGGAAKLGVHRLMVIAAEANAGKFTVEDPDGITIGVGTVGVEFTGGGLTFTLADGGTDFVVGDQFTITVNSTGSEVFTTIGELQDIQGPGLTVDTEDGTTQVSTGGWEEVVPTVKRSGEITFTVHFIPTNNTHDAGAGLLLDLNNKTKRNFQLVFPDAGATTWSFAAYVTGFNPSAPVAGRLTADVTLKLTGQPTLA